MTPGQLAVIAAQIAAARSVSDALDAQSVIARNIADALQAMVDADAPPPAPPTYALSAAPSGVDEGHAVVFTLTTTGVPAGTTVPYRLEGAASGPDIGAAMLGLFTVGDDGTATVTVPTVADLLTEGDESLQMVIDLPGVDASASATIRDTSVEPPPPLPPPPDLPQVFTRAQHVDHTLMLTEWLEGGGSYDREDKLLIWRLSDGPTATVQIRGWSWAAGDVPLLSTGYRLLVDGVERGRVTAVPAGTRLLTIPVTLTDIPEGNCLIDIEPLTPTVETCVPGIAYMQRGAAPEPQPWMWVLEGTHDVRGAPQVRWAKVPAKFEPTTRPYVLPARADFSTLLGRQQLVETDIVPVRTSDVYRTRITDGVHTAEQLEGYYWTTVTRCAYPQGISLLDGPRGCGSVVMATHLQVGRNGGVYFCDTWRVGHIQPDGTIRTLAGWRHRQPAERPRANTDAALRAACDLVGDWSAIPPERHGFREAWGLAWDARTTAQGSGPPVPNPPNGDEPPHDVDPVAFVADSQHNRIVRLQFDRASHASPAKVTEFLTGLADPWDVVCVDGVLYVSERLSHRIAAYDATTGAFLRVVVSGAALASLRTDRSVLRSGTEAQIKAQPCVAPEGLYHLDGWLYFGSVALSQIRRVHLVTGEMQTVVDIAFDHVSVSGSNFFKIAVSDGTFGPRHTVFMVSWALINGGRPLAWSPTGAGGAYVPWHYGDIPGSEGPGRVWDTLGYGCSVAVGQGRLLVSTSTEGLTDIHRASGEPIVRWADTERQRLAYQAAGLHLTHGPAGWGYYGLPLPWGRSADIDARLRWGGHAP